MKHFLKLILLLSSISLLCHCDISNERDSRYLGVVSALPKSRTSLDVVLPKSKKSPWRVRVDSLSGNEIDWEEDVEFYFSNSNGFPITVYTALKSGFVTVNPKKEILLFEGTLKEFSFFGRLAEQDLTFLDTENKPIDVEFFLVRKNGKKTIEAVFSLFRVHFGM